MPPPRLPPPLYDFVQPTEDTFIDDDLGSFVFAKDKTNSEPKIKLSLPIYDTNENVRVVPCNGEIQVTKNLNDTDIQILSKPTSPVYVKSKRKRKKKKKSRKQPYDKNDLKIPHEDEPRRKPNLNDPESRRQINELKKECYTRKGNKQKFKKDDLLFIKRVPLHPRERLKRRLQQRMKKNTKN